MRERPRFITVIGWILIVMGGDSLIRTTLNLHNPRTNEMMSRFLIPIPIQHAFSLFSPKANEYFTGTEIQGDT